MTTMFWEVGIFATLLVLIMFFEIDKDRSKYQDCLLFGRLLLATAGILIVDTIGWVIDGNPIGGQIWFTTLMDGLDLLLTTVVCWCWVQYALFIVYGEKRISRKWYQNFSTILLIVQIVLVISSQIFGFYFYVDASGVYHRSSGYFIHVLISLALLIYSSGTCILSYRREKDSGKKQELLFVALIILIPVAGNIIQLYIYGYPTVWLCMVFMVLTVYIHIQNKRVNEERKEQNQILATALKQAQSANTAKTEFLARMSHDMRTPMNGILGLTYLMEDEQTVPEMKQELPKLRESGEYLLQLINDVLDVNKVESGGVNLHPKVCDEEEVFSSIIAMVKPQMEKKSIQFHFEKVNIEWTSMMLDAQRVKQIFVNLLSNAIKFTPEGGKIDLIMELAAKDENMIRDKFIVRDSGIGISEEFLPRVFEPFAQENRIQEGLDGTGLGLSIVKSLVELMGGTISVKSQVNKGTEFTLYLNFPLARRSEDSVLPGSDRLSARMPENIHVLLCEDHPLNAQIATRLLEKEGARVTWRENGQLCVDTFAQSAPGTFDIILMDIRMPVMDGIEASQAIRAMSRADAKTIPILAMTANAYQEDIQKSLKAGMNAHLTKPIEPAAMYQSITAALNAAPNSR